MEGAARGCEVTLMKMEIESILKSSFLQHQRSPAKSSNLSTNPVSGSQATSAQATWSFISMNEATFI